MKTRRSDLLLHLAPLRVVLLLTLGALTVGPVGCGSTPTPVRTTVTPDAAPGPSKSAGRIDVDCEPRDAQVLVDDQLRGTADEVVKAGGLSLDQGHHRIEIKLEGYHPFRFELILGAKTEVIKVRLRATGKQP